MRIVYKLTPKEQNVYDLLILGQGDKEIAHALGMKMNTVKKHCCNIYAKREVPNRLKLIVHHYTKGPSHDAPRV